MTPGALGVVLGGLLSVESCVVLLLSEGASFDRDAAVPQGTMWVTVLAVATVGAFLTRVVRHGTTHEVALRIGLVASMAFAGFFALFTSSLFAWTELRSFWWVPGWFGGAFGVTFLAVRGTLWAVQLNPPVRPTRSGGLAIGAAVGMAIGAAMDNITLGMAIGAVAWLGAFGARRRTPME